MFAGRQAGRAPRRAQALDDLNTSLMYVFLAEAALKILGMGAKAYIKDRRAPRTCSRPGPQLRRRP